MKEYFNFGPLLKYFFQKRDKTIKADFTLKAMHIVNKISMALFLGCVKINVFDVCLKRIEIITRTK
jgi:hypothetical protein